MSCGAFKGRVIAVVDIIENKSREQKMVAVKAEQLSASIATSGSVALYGIYFDSGKASIQPKSDSSLREVVKLMATSPALKLLEVGHTDNVGSFEQNMGLSIQRAAAVVDKLAGKYGVEKSRLRAVGVSYSAPKSTNDTEPGRAKNRRVELVKSH